jgi:hypothetical protein
MLKHKPLPTHSTREYIFKLIDLYMVENSISWKQCVDTGTDIVQSKVQKTSGHIAHVKATTSE